MLLARDVLVLKRHRVAAVLSELSEGEIKCCSSCITYPIGGRWVVVGWVCVEGEPIVSEKCVDCLDYLGLIAGIEVVFTVRHGILCE